MKKVSVIFAAVLLAAVFVCSVYAAGIDSNEQRVLDEFKTSVNMQGVKMYWPAEFIGQAENYFNTIEITDEEADQIFIMYAQVKKQLESSGAENIADCTFDQKQELFNTLQEVMAVVGGTAAYDMSTKEVILKDKNNSIIFKGVPTLVAVLGVNKNSQKTDDEAVKTTGTSVNTTLLIVVGAVVVLTIAGVVFFVVKKIGKKKTQA